MYQVFEFIDGQFKRPLETFVSDGTSNIAEWVTGPLTAAVTLYVVLYGYLVLRGSVQEPILDFAYRAIKLAIIVMLVKNAGEYQTYVTNIFFEVLPKEIAQALNSGRRRALARSTACWTRVRRLRPISGRAPPGRSTSSPGSVA